MKVISDKYSIEDIERGLDRVALAIEENPNGEVLLPMFEFLEQQLDLRRRREATLERVRARRVGMA